MEVKFGSVWLLLSCSLQQSLWGILASVPHTNAKKCTHISSEGEPTKRVQMIRRIPARCSGWDEAWSWISKIDCRTKYVLDYVELPSAVQKVEDKDCEDEAPPKSESSTFDVTEEKFLAIAFGSATVALLILIVILVIRVVRRGQTRCIPCGSGPSYTSASNTDREYQDEHNHACNNYVDEGLKLVESEYEEIMDPSVTKKKLGYSDEKSLHYQNMEDCPNNGGKETNINGFNNGAIIPSAPYEEDLQNTARKCVQNDYSSMDVNGVTGSVIREGNSNNNATSVEGNTEVNETQQNTADQDHEALNNKMIFEKTNTCENDDGEPADNKKSDEKDAKDSEKKCESTPKHENVYSKFNDLVSVRKEDNESAQPESPLVDDKISVSGPATSHSYENLDPNTQELFVPQDYESLVHTPDISSEQNCDLNDAKIESSPKLLIVSGSDTNLEDNHPS